MSDLYTVKVFLRNGTVMEFWQVPREFIKIDCGVLEIMEDAFTSGFPLTSVDRYEISLASKAV